MKIRKYSLFTIVVVVIVSLTALAQQFYFRNTPGEKKQTIPDAVDEYKRLIAQIIDSGHTNNITGSIRLYDGEDPQLLKEQQSFQYYQNENSFCSSLGYLRTLCNGSVVLTIDSVNKYLIISKVNELTSQNAKAAMMNSLQLNQIPGDTSTNKFSGIISEDGDQRTIKFPVSNVPQIRSYSIAYNKNSYQIKSAEIIWWKTGMAALDSTKANQVWITKIDYSNTQPSPVNINQQIGRVVVLRNNRIEPTTDYKEYQIRTDL